MKNIAIFQKDLNIGGIERSLINFLNYIDYKKYNIDLYLFSKDNIYTDDINKNVNIHYLDKISSISKFIKFELVKKHYKCPITKEYDIAIDYNSYDTNCALNAILCKAKKRIIWVHNDIKIKLKEEYKYRILFNAFKQKYKYFDTFVCVSNGAKDAFIEVTKLDKEYIVIPNAIDTEVIKKQKDIKTDFKVDNNKINICSTGRLVHQKGFDLLIKEFSEVIKENNDYHLYIIGDGPEKEKLAKLISELKMDNYITLTGKYDNPFNVMNLCDAFVLMSRYEGQGMTILEAISLGLDVVIPKHLERYLDDIKGVDSVKEGILSLKKNKHKKFNDLSEYNNNIKKKINNL